jgi:hypothetical protein
MHLELVSATATQPNTGAAATALTGDTLTVKNGRGKVRIMSLWQTNQVAGFGQILFPSAHDTTRGYRAGTGIGITPTLLALAIAMDVTPQELLSLNIAGSNVAGDVEQMSMLLKYDNLPGVDQRLLTASEVMNKTKKLTTIETSVASTAGPSYGTSVVITNGSDLLRANTDYAVMGMSCRTGVHSMYLVGPDTGNVKIGMPGVLRPELTSGWFMTLSRAFGEAMVPVINSGNKSGTFVGVTTDENAGTFITTLYLAQL